MQLYLDLLKDCLLASIYEENSWYVLGSLDSKPKSLKERVKAWLVRLAWQKGLLLVKPNGGGWGLLNLTMIGRARLDNIQACIEDVLANGIEGDLIETGVWRGGAAIFMRGVLKAHDVTDRTVWVADSFAGLPQSETHDPNITTMNEGGPMQLALIVPLERVKRNFANFHLLDNQVRFLKGWFKDTLPVSPIKSIAVLRLDGDLYESTMDALNALYGKVSKGGYVIVDDYNTWPGCERAVDEFRKHHGIRDRMIAIDDAAVFWKVS